MALIKSITRVSLRRVAIGHSPRSGPPFMVGHVSSTAIVISSSKIERSSNDVTETPDRGGPGSPPRELEDYPGKQFTSEWQIKVKGKIYDKKPFKFRCEKDKVYKWCACGLSRNQPFCDGSHNGPLMKSVLRPVSFIPTEDKDYWFCNCKQTDHRPLCDGTHLDPKIQAAIKS